MAKKRGPKQVPTETTPPKRAQYAFRPDDNRILQVAESYGRTVRQSVNGVINLALAEFLRERGVWPPPPPPPDA